MAPRWKPIALLVAVLAVAGLGDFALGPQGQPSQAQAVKVTGSDCGDIRAAINGLPSAGGEVILGARTYRCSKSIVIDGNGVSLRGAGPATVLRLADHVNRPVLILGQTVAAPTVTRKRLQVADLMIDGNRANQDFECHSGPCAGGDYLRNNGISLRRVTDVLIERVTVKRARSGGLVTELGSRRITVRDFTALDNEFDGIAGYQTEDSLFTGLHLHDNQGAGLSLDVDFNHNTISDSVLASNQDVGVFMRDSADNVFSAVHIRDSGSHGMFLAQVDGDASKPASGNTFTGMVISQSGQNPVKGGHGMRVNDASCTDNLVVGTQFVQNRDGGISEPVPGLVTQSGVIVR